MTEKIDVDIEGSLKCLIVYSDKKHVDYVDNLLNYIQLYFKNNDKRFQTVLLNEEILSGGDYYEEIDALTTECVLSIIILDGFRPNVLFELGMLKAKKKPVMILQDKNAKISIKNFYTNTHDSGLTQDKFDKLNEPKLDVKKDLSDFAGKHIVFIDKNAQVSDEEFIQNKIKTEIKKLESHIISETAKITKKVIPQDMAEKLSYHSMIISKIYHNISKHKISEIDDVCKKISSIIEGQDKSQYSVYKLVADTYVQKSKTVSYDRREDIDHCLDSAIKIYKEMTPDLPRENTKIMYSEINHNLGIIYASLAKITDAKANCEKAIGAYSNALKIYTEKEYPRQIAMVQNNLGIVYKTLATIFSKEANITKSIKAYSNALKIYTEKEYPLEYAMVQNNLGGAYRIFSGVTDAKANITKSIRAFTNALKIRTEKEYPLEYATVQNNLGNSYANLAEVTDVKANCEKAIKAFTNALKIETEKEYPLEYATVQNNLGTAYGRFAEISDKEANITKSIKAFTNALKIRTEKEYPLGYATVQNNLGNVYRILAEITDAKANCKKAIKAHSDALKIRTEKEYPLEYASTLSNLGNVYKTLAEITDVKANCKKAIKAYSDALKIRTEKEYPLDFAVTQYNLGNVYIILAEITDAKANCEKAIKAHSNALRVTSKKESPQRYQLYKKQLEDTEKNTCK